jgi:xanthine dehydrogenase accessory factor
MLVLENGRFEGSVSGGCVENAVMTEVADVISNNRFLTRRYGVTNESAWAVGLPCGGEIEVMIQPVSPNGFRRELFSRLAAAQADGEPVQLTTDAMGHTSEQLGGSGFVNIYRPPRRMLIVGAVQIAQSLAVIAQEVGMRVTLIDPRGLYLTPERFPGITLDSRWPDEAVAALVPNNSTAVVTLSHDTKLDDPALAAALRAPTGYIAALGSRRSHATRLQRLSLLGFTSAELQRIEGPAGLKIGAVGSSEIALSIIASAVKELTAGEHALPDAAYTS